MKMFAYVLNDGTVRIFKNMPTDPGWLRRFVGILKKPPDQKGVVEVTQLGTINIVTGALESFDWPNDWPKARFKKEKRKKA